MEKYRAKEDISYEDLDNDINIPKIKKDETVYINYEKVSFGNKKYVIRKDNDEKDKITICSYLDFNKFERVEEIEMLSKKLIVGNKYHYKDLCELLNENNMGNYSKTNTKRMNQLKKWENYFSWKTEDIKKKYIHTITELKEFKDVYNSKSFDHLDNVCGVYILYSNHDKPYIGQSTNLKRRLLQHYQGNSISKYEILEVIDSNIIPSSKYLITTCLLYLEDKYIKKYGIENLSNKIFSFEDCCCANSISTLYNFKECTKEITYNLCMELIHCEYNFERFFKENENFRISNMSKYPYYKEYKALESLKSSISSYLGLGYSIYDINNPTVDTIVDYIDTFRVKG